MDEDEYVSPTDLMAFLEPKCELVSPQENENESEKGGWADNRNTNPEDSRCEVVSLDEDETEEEEGHRPDQQNIPEGRLESTVVEKVSECIDISMEDEPTGGEGDGKSKRRKGAYQPSKCSCTYKCKLISETERMKIFKEFHDLKNWQLQTACLVQNVICNPVKQRVVANDSKPFKSVSRRYFLKGRRVCKSVFLSSFGITNTRLDYAIRIKSKGGRISPDRRGYMNANRTPERRIIRIKLFLEQIPSYKPHSTSKIKYINPDLNYIKLYNLYLETLRGNTEDKVSYKIFRRIFDQCDIRIYNPKTDTCDGSDQLYSPPTVLKGGKEPKAKSKLPEPRCDDPQRFAYQKYSLPAQEEYVPPTGSHG